MWPSVATLFHKCCVWGVGEGEVAIWTPLFEWCMTWFIWYSRKVTTIASEHHDGLDYVLIVWTPF